MYVATKAQWKPRCTLTVSKISWHNMLKHNIIQLIISLLCCFTLWNSTKSFLSLHRFQFCTNVKSLQFWTDFKKKIQSNVHWRIAWHVVSVPKHMKRFESILRFDSTEINCLLINVLYIEFYNAIFRLDLILRQCKIELLKMGSNFLIYTGFTSLAMYLLLLVAAIYWYLFLDACSCKCIFFYTFLL